jgi:hypothetical protein
LEDKKFMENSFHYEKRNDIMNINYKYRKIDEQRLKKILDFCNYPDRISKWFHVVKDYFIH